MNAPWNQDNPARSGLRVLAILATLSAFSSGCPSSMDIADGGAGMDGGSVDGGNSCAPTCAAMATCVAMNVCECNAGYSGDGFTCTLDVMASCGDGTLDDGEACDDNNREDGDGCSAACVVERCGDGVVNNGEPCDGGAGCTDECEVDPGPSLVSSLPADGAEGVAIATEIRLVFSEPVDPASISTSTIRIGPIGPMDGLTFDNTTGMPGIWSVDGNEATFRPSRRHFQEFETPHHITVTSGVLDLAGNAFDGDESLGFTTLMVDPNYRYHIRNAQFPNRLDTFADTRQAHLTAANTSGSYWNFTPRGDRHQLRNEFGGDDLYLEGGDGSEPALLTVGGNFTGQQWEVLPTVDRSDAGAGESPWLCHLATQFQGPGRSLGVMFENPAGVLVIGTQDVGFLDQQWFLENAGPRTGGVAVEYNSTNGHYYARIDGRFMRWEEARAAAESLQVGGRPGYLASVTSAEEQTFIGDTLGWGLLWIGGLQDLAADDYAEPAGGWRWTSGEPFVFAPWATGEPSNGDSGEHWLSTFDDGSFNDNVENWNYSPGNDGFIVEF